MPVFFSRATGRFIRIGKGLGKSGFYKVFSEKNLILFHLIFREWNIHETRKLSVNYKQAAILIGVSVVFFEHVNRVFANEFPLNKLIQVRSLVIPGVGQLVGSYQQLTNIYITLRCHKNRMIRKTPVRIW